MKDTRYSIITNNLNKCFICGRSPVHLHEVFFGTANRNKSIEDGCVVPLCPAHHNMSGDGVHFNKKLDDYLKILAEKHWINKYTDNNLSQDEKVNIFIERYGRNYIE